MAHNSELDRYSQLQARFAQRSPVKEPELQAIQEAPVFDDSFLNVTVAQLVPAHLVDKVTEERRALTISDLIFEVHTITENLSGIKHDFLGHLSMALLDQKWPVTFALLKSVDESGEPGVIEFSFATPDELKEFFAQRMTAVAQRKFDEDLEKQAAKDAYNERRKAEAAERKARVKARKAEEKQREKAKKKKRPRKISQK